MKRQKLRTLCLAALVAGCAPNAGVMSVEKFFPVEAGCGFPMNIEDSLLLTAGSLDVAIFNPEFWAGISVTSQELKQNAISTGSTELEPADRDVPTITGVVFSYRVSQGGRDVTPASLRGKKYTFPKVAPLDANFRFATIVNLISPQAAEALPVLGPVDELIDGYDMLVGVEVTGRLSRSGAPISTGPVDFPIKVLNTSPTTCAKPQRLLAGCVFTGQSGYQVKPATPRCCDQLPQTPPAIGCDYTP